MTGGVVPGIALAALAACCYTLAAVLQHGAVRTVTEAGRLSLRGLLGQPRWLCGLLAAGAGGAVHVVALAEAPLVVVQPVGVLAIGLTVLATAVTGRTRLTRRCLLAVVATTVGVGAFVSFAAFGSHGGGTPGDAVGTVLLICGAAVGALALLGLRARGLLRCPLLASAAGIAYGSVSVLTRAVAAGVRANGLAAGLNPWALLGIVAGVLAGIWCAQQAYASGRPDIVVACQTVLDPLVGVLLGGWLYGEAGHWSPPIVLAELVCAALATAGVLMLARAHTEPAEAVAVIARGDTTGAITTPEGAHRELSRI